MSHHREMMAMARQVLGDVAGRSSTYTPPGSVPGGSPAACTVRHTSAEDKTVETDNGLERRREATVNVTIGAAGLAAVHIGGTFLLDVDGGAAEPWTIESFANADAGDGGNVRCLCVRPIRQTGVVGKPRTDR